MKCQVVIPADMLIEQETVEAFHMSGQYHDCGDKLGYALAFVQYALNDKKLGDDFRASLNKMLSEHRRGRSRSS